MSENKITLSVAVKKHILAIIIMKNGNLIEKKVKKIYDEELQKSPYLELMEALSQGFCLLKPIIDNDADIDTTYIEINNSAMIKWFEDFYSKPDYQEKFTEVLDALNDLPIKYVFLYREKPFALSYATEKEIVSNKKTLSGIEDLF